MKWKEWWQTVQEIMEEQIQDSLKIICADEEAYLNELVTYRLQFEGYKYDHLISKLVGVHVTTFQKFSLMQVATVATSSWSEHVVTTIEEP